MSYVGRKLPKRRMMPPKETARIECDGHRALIRSHECCVAGKLKPPHDQCVYRHDGKSDPHHSKTRGAYGGDETCVPLCRYHHNLLDSPGWSQEEMEKQAKVSFRQIAAWHAAHSDPLKRYYLKQAQA